MTFYISVYSGLNNKLLPLISLLRIALKENRKIKCYWGEDKFLSSSNFEFNDLFNEIENIEFITKEEFEKELDNDNNIIYNKNGSCRNKNSTIFIPNDKTAVFYNVVHCISYQDDNFTDNFIPYPFKFTKRIQVIDDLRNNIKTNLIPSDDILNRINSDFFSNNKVLGIHLRTTDGGFKKIPINNIFYFIDSFFKKLPSYKIYISADNLKLENEIVKKYPDKIYYLKNPFGKTYNDKFDRTTYANKNAVCEMFSLSKCNYFVGTPGSSFTFMVWLLRNENTLNFWCKNPF